MTYVIATDIGGTFTDLVAFDVDTKQVFHSKSHTDSRNLTGGILRCLEKTGLALELVNEFVHGSTVAINTVIERKGATTALIVTRGTRDVYAIGRGNRPEAYNVFFHRPEPLVPRSRTLEVDGRLDASGRELEPITQESLRSALEGAYVAGCESIAVCLLHSYASPAHEVAVAEVVTEMAPDVYQSLSHEILREYREYERMSTTVLNAYVGPRVSEYIAELESALTVGGFAGTLMIMQSNGGVMAPELARRQPIRTMESGPVGGVIAAGQLSKRLGVTQAVVLDMGGTTAKAALVRDGEPEMSEGYFVGGSMSGHPVMLPVVDVIEVGAGGGSIARIDDVGALNIGPESAGGYPGPICYGWGGVEPTVTDANAVLGRLNPARFLGGEMVLDVDSASSAIEVRIAAELGLSVDAAAQAILEVAVNKMALAVRAVSIERGLDARDCVMIAFGGAGPLHACDVARDLSIPIVVVPPLPGHYSALGMLLADVRHDFVRTCYGRLDEVAPPLLAEIFSELENEARRLLAEEGVEDGAVRIQRLFDLRYVGQEFTLRTPVEEEPSGSEGLAEVRRRFDRLHQERFGHAAPDELVELVNVRLVGSGRRDVPEVRSDTTAAAPPRPEWRSVGFTGADGCVRSRCAVHRREELPVGTCIEGPAIIEEYASTVVLDGGDSVVVGDWGELTVKIQPREERR